jgi:hypothetical protein
MQKFISENRGYIILSMMLVGMAAIGFGLDWDQTQVHWKEKFVWPLLVTGVLLFGGGCLWLATGRGRKD